MPDELPYNIWLGTWENKETLAKCQNCMKAGTSAQSPLQKFK